MGYQQISLKLPTDFSEEDLREIIEKTLQVRDFSYQIENKSLDARMKHNIHWLVQVRVVSKEIWGEAPDDAPVWDIPFKKTDKKAVVVGSGPAGFFSAFVLQKAGIDTVLIERGAEVIKRAKGIRNFEETGRFDPVSNYAFGEGGAGTFSDGKLTSRTKRIKKEKQFIVSKYIDAGAPEEIRYMAHPHLGSDNLKKIVRNLRKEFLDIGGTLLFETMLKDLKIKDGKVVEAMTSSGVIEADYFVIAPGHSAHETYRMLINSGVMFNTKNFAIGCRVEHPQELINLAQWGHKSLAGVKAAEYRLTSKGDGNFPVYTFCMCPGGVIVPSTAYENINIVNGMSRYKRDGRFANAGCVAGINLNKLLGKEIGPLEAVEWLGSLEESFYTYSGGYQAPYCNILDFINRKQTAETVETSYPMGLTSAPLWEMLPPAVISSMTQGLKDFGRKIKGFETGIIMGLESKTSSPLQAVREEDGSCAGFENLYIAGEGSGHSGGIISSGADGIRAAINIIERS